MLITTEVALTGCRFSAVNVEKQADVPEFDKIVEQLAADDEQRIDFLKACLWKLGLEVTEGKNAVPSLSRLHLSSYLPAATSELMVSLSEIITAKDSQEFIEDETDTFLLERASAGSIGSMTALNPRKGKADEKSLDEDRIIDYKTGRWFQSVHFLSRRLFKDRSTWARLHVGKYYHLLLQKVMLTPRPPTSRQARRCP